jgi:hypothetical protein
LWLWRGDLSEAISAGKNDGDPAIETPFEVSSRTKRRRGERGGAPRRGRVLKGRNGDDGGGGPIWETGSASHGGVLGCGGGKTRRRAEAAMNSAAAATRFDPRVTSGYQEHDPLTPFF